MSAIVQHAAAQAAAFVAGELVPTLAALVGAAGREPLGWLAAALGLAVWQRLGRR